MEIRIISKRVPHPEITNKVYVGHPHILANRYTHIAGIKYTVHVKTVKEAVAMYEDWLRDSIDNNVQPVINALDELYRMGKEKPLYLECKCKDEVTPSRRGHTCHAEVIRKILLEQEQLDKAAS